MFQDFIFHVLTRTQIRLYAMQDRKMVELSKRIISINKNEKENIIHLTNYKIGIMKEMPIREI